MRFCVMLLLVTACSDKPSAPDPKQFAALGEEAKCAATLPRAKRCIDELMAQQIERLMQPASEADKQATQQLAKEMRQETSASDEAEKVHETNCAASEHYADAVVACWAEPDCRAFAACVIEKDAATLPSPSSPSPSGTAP